MTQSPPTEHSPTSHELLEMTLAQLEEDQHEYDRAVESYNEHLANHRERRDLHDLPPRLAINEHQAFEAALLGKEEELNTVLAWLLEQAHLDSEVRRHPRVYPIHIEAVEHLELARDQLVFTLEEALRQLEDDQ